MKKNTLLEFTVKTRVGDHYTKEDSNTMEIHDAIDYLVIKYITKGGKFAALPVKIVTDMSRIEQTIREKNYE